MEKLVKVKYVLDRHRVKWIEVKESEVEAIKAINRMTWREIKAQEREYKKLDEMGIKVCSLDGMMENGGDVVEDSDPLNILIAEEEAEERKAMIEEAMQYLSDEQKEIVQMRFYENMSLDEIALQKGSSYQAIQNKIEKILKKFRKNI